ncbi:MULTISPECIES: AAA family ATPase [unclassified Avibacterium]|uniref:AAA family ATPase n=1 Tax=unclassified Avibacterium TaxID=2685287 RepID=UPI0020274A44|nr:MULTISPECIES: ATP-binding protein [unclassified Avibacterium]MCW9718940.1 ATP-binding protein [Avibacterium sp. 21-599]MCW9733155.1 ATP-binding protein [Avibacterium sp. 20-15]URL05274.1 ATP-binding protein [Avibacterium sp. 20-132]
MRDPLYFPRSELASRLLISLKDGIMHALTLFAPRRMGKTQFLLNDIKPLAEEMGFNVFYFSFMEKSDGEMRKAFNAQLLQFLDSVTSGANKFTQAIKQLKSVDVLGVGIELESHKAALSVTASGLLNELAEKSKKPVLMLLDEVQELAREKGNADFIQSLRTGLDVNQNKIKVIFTGSSTNGLRLMFNDNKAPFFHFAHAIDFPHLDRAFTDFLADIYHDRTGKTIDKDDFYHLFERFHFTPLYMRSIAQDMIINHNLTLEEAADYRLSQMADLSEVGKEWGSLSLLEREILKLAAQGETTPYKKATRENLAQKIGVDEVSSSSIQGQLRKLEKKELITRDANKAIKINNPHFQTWIKENCFHSNE